MLLRASPVLLTRRNAAYLPSCIERPAVHHEQPHVAFAGGGQVLLGDAVAVADHGVDHLVEIGPLVFADEEHVLAAGALQRLDDDLAVLLVDELLDLVDIAADARFRPDLFGEVLEVGFVERVGQVLGIVEHDHAAAARRAGRRGCRRSAAQGRSVASVDGSLRSSSTSRSSRLICSGWASSRLQLVEKLFERLVRLAVGRCGRGRGSSRRRRRRSRRRRTCSSCGPG